MERHGALERCEMNVRSLTPSQEHKANIHRAAIQKCYTASIRRLRRWLDEKARDQPMTATDIISDLEIKRSTWQKLVHQGQTPPIARIGTAQRIRLNAFHASLEQRANQPSVNPE
jgi:hypothetical protein